MEGKDNYKLLQIKKIFDNGGKLASCEFKIKTNARAKKNQKVKISYNVNNPKLLPFLEQCIENSKSELENLQEKLEFVTTGKEARKHETRKSIAKTLIYAVSIAIAVVGLVPIVLPVWGGPFTFQALLVVSLVATPKLASLIVNNEKFMNKSFAEKSCIAEITETDSQRKELENIKSHLLGKSQVNKGAIERGKDVIRRYILQKPRTKEEYETLREFYSNYGKQIELEISRSDGTIRRLDHDFFDGIEKPTSMDGIWLSEKKVTYMADRLMSSLVRRAEEIEEKQQYIKSLPSGAAVVQALDDPEYKKARALRRQSSELRNRANRLTYDGMRRAVKQYASSKARLEALRRKKGKIVGYIEANDQKFGKTR